MSVEALRFSAIVLAAGTSSRMRGRHKLLLPVGGEPVIRRTVRTVLEAQPQEVVVVTGFQERAVSEALAGLPIRLQSNVQFAQGQMTSMAAGAAALGKPTDAVMVCLGDMVLLTCADYRELVDAFARLGDRSILVPHHQGQRGNPVVFAARHLPEVISGRRNPGCRRLIADYPEEVFVYESTHDRFVADMDTPEDYARMVDRLGLAGIGLEARVV
jgi:molybdenum cofactor cytidylyltransferase